MVTIILTLEEVLLLAELLKMSSPDIAGRAELIERVAEAIAKGG